MVREGRYSMSQITHTPWHKMELMDALSSFSSVNALPAGQLHAQRHEHGLLRSGVPHPQKPRVEVDLAGQRADRQQARVPHDHQRRHRLVEEAGIDVCGFLEDDHVPASPLRRGDLRERK